MHISFPSRSYSLARSFYYHLICIIIDTIRRYKQNITINKIAKVQLVRKDSRMSGLERKSGVSGVAKYLVVACYPLMHRISNFSSPEGHLKN